nr:transposase [Halomonas ventosae]
MRRTPHELDRVGVDIAKSIFHVHNVGRHDQVKWRGKYRRDKWLDAIANRVPISAEIAMEACASSHHWARTLQARGYHIKLIAAQFVKPYVKSNKNDRFRFLVIRAASHSARLV